ncbi:MAG: serine/threonine protein kinase [Planctomycetes bacterium]|nr:serine/threonine protein kinase [Planctomycetota bacterium]
MARIEHGNVVRVLDAGEHDGQPWLAMEFVDGETLEAWIRRRQQAGGHRAGSLREFVQIVAQVAAALRHVHGLGILHRDLKPSNVLLGRDGSVKLTDFGLSRDASTATLTRQGHLAGTPHYLAPEYVTRGEVTPASDVFALGVLLYEGATLVRPFDGATPDLVLHRVVHHDPADARQLQPELPRDLAAVIGKAIEKAPDRRYESMAAFADDLQAFLDLRVVSARTLTRLQRARRWLGREPWRAALVACVVLLLVVTGFLLVRLPLLAAGERAAQAAAYETAIAEGFLRRGEGNRELAEAAAARALALRPDAGEAMVVAALARLRFHGAESALAELDRLRAQPHDDDDSLLRLRALVLGRLGRSAERDALLATLPQPTSQMGLLLAAGLLVETPSPTALPAARRLISMATRIAPPRLLVHAQWAVLAEPTAGEEVAEVLLRLWPEQPFVLHLAAARRQYDDAAAALALQQRALAAGLQDEYADYNLAAYASKAGRADLAVPAARRAIADPRLAEPARIACMQVLTDHAPDQVDAAIADWLVCFPGSALARREHGRARSLRGDHAGAVELLAAASIEAPDDTTCRWVHGWALQGLGDWAGAATIAGELVRREPAGSAAHDLLVTSLLQLPDRGHELLAERRRFATVAASDGAAWRELAAQALATDGLDAKEALLAAMHADAIAAGQDAEALALLAAAHDRLGEATAAAAVRERAGRLASGR